MSHFLALDIKEAYYTGQGIVLPLPSVGGRPLLGVLFFEAPRIHIRKEDPVFIFKSKVRAFLSALSIVRYCYNIL